MIFPPSFPSNTTLNVLWLRPKLKARELFITPPLDFSGRSILPGRLEIGLEIDFAGKEKGG